MLSSVVENTKNWLKDNKREVIIAVFIFLVSTTSFALGYLISKDAQKTPIIIEKCSK